MGAVAVFTRRLGNVAVLAVQFGVVEIVLARELVDVHVVVVVLVAEAGVLVAEAGVLVAEAGVPELWRLGCPGMGLEVLIVTIVTIITVLG